MTPCRLGQAHPLLGRPALRLWRRRRGEGGRPLSRHQRCARDRHRRARAARGEDRGVVTPGNTHLKERTVYAQSITVSEDAPSLESTPTLNRFGTSRVDRAANGPCRSYSSGFGTEVRLFLENRTTAAANVRTGFNCWARPQADQAASSRGHSASLVQPWRIIYWASSADISMVPSGLTLMCRPEKVCTAPIPQGACRRTRYRSGFSGF